MKKHADPVPLRLLRLERRVKELNEWAETVVDRLDHFDEMRVVRGEEDERLVAATKQATKDMEGVMLRLMRYVDDHQAQMTLHATAIRVLLQSKEVRDGVQGAEEAVREG